MIMISLKESELLIHMAAQGHTGASGNKLDYRNTEGATGHNVCNLCRIWIKCYKILNVITNLMVKYIKYYTVSNVSVKVFIKY